MKALKILLALFLASVVLCACSAQNYGPFVSPEDISSDPSSGTEEESPENLTTTPVLTDTQIHSDPPAQTDPAETQVKESEEPAVSASFSARFPNCKALGLLYNEPYRLGIPEADVVWNEGECDTLYLIPRLVGTSVRAYSVSYSDDGRMEISSEPAYETISEDGTVISACLARPEGGPAWYVEMTSPAGEAGGMLLSYNGRYGTAQYEFIQALPEGLSEAPAVDLIGVDYYAAFVAAAEKAELSADQAVKVYLSKLEELGDGASFVLCSGGDMDSGSMTLQCARFHERYYTPSDSLEECVTEQYKLYGEIGNEYGILGPEFSGTLPDLYYELTGLTVFNSSLAAKQISVDVNGTSAGEFILSDSEFCNLIPISLSPFIADSPVTIRITVLSTFYGEPSDAVFEVFPGLASNISDAR